MSLKQNDYDFLCTNDTTQIKLAINGDGFYAAEIQSEAVKKIDLTGGTKNIENITLAHCLKLTRIIWPNDTGAIKRLAIHSADVLTKLDVSTLTNLQELSIFNCHKLKSVTGLGKSIKIVNAHGVNLKTLNLSRAKNIEKLNVLTTNSHFNVSIKKFDALQCIFIQGLKVAVDVRQCPTLTSLLVTGDSKSATLKILDCLKLVDACVIGNEASLTTGLEDCKNVTLHSAASKKAAELKKMASNFIAPILQCKAGSEDMETVIQKFGTIRERNHACIIRISLLHNMNLALAPEPEPEKQETAAKMPVQETRAPEKYPAIIFLPETRIAMADSVSLSSNRFQTKEENIIDWLQNPERKKVDLLVLSKKDLKNLAILNLLKQIEQKRQVLTFMGIQYKQPLARKIYADFPRWWLSRAPLSMFNVSAPPVTYSAALATDKKLSDNIMQRNMADTIRILNMQDIQRTTNNALNRILRLRRQLTILRQAYHENMDASAGDNAKQKLNESICAPPKLIPQPDKPPHMSPLKNEINISSHFELSNTDSHLQQPPLPKHAVKQKPPTDSAGHAGASDFVTAAVKQAVKPEPTSVPPGLAYYQDVDTLLVDINIPKTIALNLDQEVPLDIGELKNSLKSVSKSSAPGELGSAEPKLIDEAYTSASLISLEETHEVDTELTEESAKQEGMISIRELNTHVKGAIDFANSLALLTKEAKQHSPGDEISANQLLLIEQSIGATLHDLHIIKKVGHKKATDGLLAAAQALCGALSELTNVCKSDLNLTSTESNRTRLITLLANLSEKFITSNRAQEPSNGLFGTGFKGGINHMRMNLLTDLLQALKSNQAIATLDFNNILKELMKDKELKSALQPEIAALRQHLTIAYDGPAKKK